MNNVNNNLISQDTLTSGLATVSKTPFRTAVKVTVGVGVGHMINFFIFVTGCCILYKLFH